MNAFSMIRLRQFLAVYLAATLAVAGAAGLSPLLHLWLEHGGLGAPHVHHGAGEAKRVRVQGRLARGHALFALPKVSTPWLRQLAHRLAHAAEESGQPATPADAPGHEHHSLAQTLASGLLDAAPSPEILPHRASLTFRLPAPAHPRAASRELDLHSAGRAPPVGHG